MKNFVESYPQFSKMSGAATKHLNVVHELFSYVGKFCLMDVSELEQDIVTQDDHNQHVQVSLTYTLLININTVVCILLFLFQRIKALINNNKIRDIDAVRLVLLYSLRYKRNGDENINGFVTMLRKRGAPERLVDVS